MRRFARLSHRLRQGRENQRTFNEAHRAILGSLEVGGRKEPLRLWRVLVWMLFALVLYQAEAGLLAHLKPGAPRIEVAVIFVAFAALHLRAIEGALAAFVVGYVADLFVQGPPGLCRFMAVASWTCVRLLAGRVVEPAWIAAGVTTLGATAFYKAGVLTGLQLVAPEGLGPGTNAWLSVVPEAVLTALFAMPLHQLLLRIERATAGTEPAR